MPPALGAEPALRVRPGDPSPTSTGFRIVCTLDGAPEGLPDEVWYEVDSPDAEVTPPETADFAAIAALPLAMRLGAPLVVDGPVRLGLIRNLLEYVDAWSLWRPALFARVPIEAESEAPSPPPSDERGTVLTYSGGLDSSFAFVGHMTGLFGPRSFPISVAAMIHGLDIPLEAEEGFQAAARSARAQVGEHFGVPLATVQTNWRELSVNWGLTFAAGVAAVLHLFDRSASRGILANDRSYANSDIGMGATCGSNPVTNHLLGDCGFPVLTTGFGYDRIQKAAGVARYPSVAERLRVCMESETYDDNCRVCRKCTLIQLAFTAAGVDPPSALGYPQPAILRTLEPADWGQRVWFEEYVPYRRNLPLIVREAYDEMMVRERRRLPDPHEIEASAEPGQSNKLTDPRVEELEKALADSRAFAARLERELHAIASSRRVRAATSLMAPFDRVRTTVRRAPGRGRSSG